MESPLVNEYKKPLILRRLLQTFLGGLRIWLPSSAPIYVYAIQVTIFLLTPITCGALIVVKSNETFSIMDSSVVVGVIAFVINITISIFALCLHRRKCKTQPIEQVISSVDEETLYFDSICGPKTWTFLVPPKQWYPNVVLHSLIYGLVWGLVFGYLTYDFSLQTGVTEDFYTFHLFLGLIAVTIGTHGLLVGSPPEPATYHSLSCDFSALSRPAHILVYMLLAYLSSTNYQNDISYWVTVITRTMFLSSPILWLFGFLPPIDALLLWSLERLQINVLGGSPTSSNETLKYQLVQGLISILNMARIDDLAIRMIAFSLRGYFLSLDLGWLARMAIQKIKMSFTANKTGEKERPTASTASRQTVKQDSIFYLICLLLLFGIIVGTVIPTHAWLNGPMTTNDSAIADQFMYNNTEVEVPFIYQESTINAFGVLNLALIGVSAAINLVQNIYIFSFVRNSLYELSNTHSSMFLWASEFIQYGGAFLQLMYLNSLIGAQPITLSSSDYLNHLLKSIPIGYCYRQIWQNGKTNSLILGIYFVSEEWPMDGWWTEIRSVTKIFILSLLYIWLVGIYEKLKAILLIAVTSISDAKQRKPINYLINGANIISLPLLLVTVILSAILSMPILPIFSLPIFILGFPRLYRFWPCSVGYSANRCLDTIYYEQISPNVIKAFHQKAVSGALGFIEPGCFYLLRFEDRFAWMQILESGFGYQIYSMKGLELQETSCHTIEASRVDTIFNDAFESNNALICFPFHCLTPLTQLIVDGYSDTRNVLTGVIESRDTLLSVKDFFAKCLLYFLLRAALERKKLPFNASISRPNSHQMSSIRNPISNFIRKSLPSIKGGLSSSQGSVVSTRRDAAGDQTSRQAWAKSNSQYSPSNLHSTSTDSLQSVYSYNMNSEQSLQKTNSYKMSKDTQSIKNSTHNIFGNNSNIVSKMHTIMVDDVTSVNPMPSPHPFTSLEPIEVEESSKESGKLFTKYNPNSKKRSRFSTNNNNSRLIYNSYLSDIMAPDSSLLSDLPYDEETLEETQDMFPLSWFKFILQHNSQIKLKNEPLVALCNVNSVAEKREMLDKVIQDDVLEESYRTVLAVCQQVVIGSELFVLGPAQVLKAFNAQFNSSPGLDWLKEREDLLNYSIKAYRIAVKLAIDQSLLGPLNSSWRDLKEIIDEYSTSWYIGPESSNEDMHFSNETNCWTGAVKSEKPKLFSIGYSRSKRVYTSRMLTLGPLEVNVGKLERELVFSLWASLAAELLYLTNDDDERYSIQAHPTLLRNLTIQAADPPLGYPVYSSLRQRLGIHPI